MYYGFEKYYILLVVPAFIFSLYAQFRVKGTFSKYSGYRTSRAMTGADVARYILRTNGISDVEVLPIPGDLTDHYDPKKKVVGLSETVYGSNSIAAIGVAAHETGHALQHYMNYAPLNMRSMLVPVAGIGSSIGPYLAIFGLMFNSDLLLGAGILLFTLAVAFYIITLPVEFNASARAIELLRSSQFFSEEEIKPVKSVLRAAAMTYVASAAVAMANLLRLVLLANSRRGDD